MNTEHSTQAPTRRLSWIRWVAWGGLILMGGTILLLLFGLCQSVAKDGWHSRKLPFFMFAVIFVIGFFGMKAATHPIRGRRDERRAWKERFPTHTDQEFERFLRVVGDSVGVSEKHLCRLRPDDRVTALTQEWLCGDGMDIIELFMDIEREYGLDLPESCHEKTQTLADLFAYVTQHSPGRPPPAASERPDKSVSG